MSGPTIHPPTSYDTEITDPMGRSSPFSLGRTTILPDTTKRSLDAGADGAGGERFAAEKTIGEGGSGLVARAVDADLSRKVAIKRLHEHMQEPGDVARFVREVRLMGSLEHPNIVPVYDVGQGEDDAYYAVMKWVEGVTLQVLIEQLRSGDLQAHANWDFDARTRLFMEVCRGINHANQRGILHRDIKPGNIMITPDGSVQILDWGLAKAVDEAELPELPNRPREAWQTMAGGLLGTPAYMAPEQARGEPYTHRTEVFALGALFWELLTLRPLWLEHLGTDEMVVYAQQRDLPVPFHMRPDPVQGPVPSHLSWFVWRAVRPDPMNRFATVDALSKELQRRAAGVFPVQCPATFQRRTLMQATRLLDRYPRGFPLVVGSWAVTVLSLVFLFGLWL